MKRTFIGIQKHLANERCEFVHISDDFLKLVGYTKQEVKDKFNNSLYDMIVQEDRDSAIEELKKQLSGDTLFSIHFRIPKKDGEIVWLYAQGCIVKEDDIFYFYSEVVDASDYYNLDQYYKNILNFLPIPILFLNEQKRIVFLNQSATELFGFTLKQCIGKHYSILKGIGAKDLCLIENLNSSHDIIRIDNLNDNSYEVFVTHLPDLHHIQKPGYLCVFSETK